MTDVIEIKNEDVLDNFDNVLTKNNTFSCNSDLESINTYIFYIDNDEIANYKKYQIAINDNNITKKELMAIILNNNKYYSKKYDLIGIYKYCFNLEKYNLKDFCVEQNNFNLITKYDKIENIPFDRTIDLFQSNNSLILIFSRNSKQQKNNKKNRNQIRLKIKPKNM